MRRTVIGQTGSVVLSDDAVQRKLEQKRTVRYQYTKMKCGWMAWVCGPFHSRTYGMVGYGTKKSVAKAALQHNLEHFFGYIGRMLHSAVDTADTIGLSPAELWHRSNNEQREALRDAMGGPITVDVAVGEAGM